MPGAGRRAASITVYWHQCTNADWNGSRVGRTITTPRLDDPATVRVAFVSCQSVNEGWQNAWRKMIWEDERAPEAERLGFVLHRGDFIYEVVEYPDEVPHRYGRVAVLLVGMMISTVAPLLAVRGYGRGHDAFVVLGAVVPSRGTGQRYLFRGASRRFGNANSCDYPVVLDCKRPHVNVHDF